jgi:glycosyltransferase involved in cell wall biosynthesis
MKNNDINTQKRNIAFVYQPGCHSVTKAYARLITNKSYCIKDLPLHFISGIMYAFYLAVKIPKYDIYFTDSAMANLVPIFKRWFGDKNIIIYRGADGIFGEKSDAYLYTKNKIKKKILLYILKNIDGINTESEMAKNDAKKWVDCPIELGVSYIDNIERLAKIKPDLNTKKFLFIGDYRPPYDHKGIEILIDTFNLLDNSYELYIIGKNTDKLRNRVINNGIHIEGKVPSLEEYFKKCTYYIHTANYETGPITVLEAMSCGLIPIISKNCGHKTVVQEINKNLVLPNLNPRMIAKEIVRIRSTKKSILINYSNKAKKIINYEYSKENKSAIFKKNFNKLIEEIEQKKNSK